MEKTADWKEVLQNKGLRCTEQRLEILRVLGAAEQPLAAQEIFDKVDNKRAKLRLSTVYRALNSFTKEGIIRKLNLGDRTNKFELQVTSDHHHHLVCIECGEIVPLDCPLPEFEDYLAQETGYDICEHQIKFYGVCPECKKSE